MARLRGVGRVLASGAAIVLAAVATVAITTYVRGIEQRAFDDAELVEVFVAQEEIPAGMSSTGASEAGLIGRDRAPRASVPDGAITALDQLDGQVALERILVGETIVRGRWADPAVATRVLDIPEGFEAISVEVGVPPGVAGFVEGGDQVSLIVTVQEPPTVTTDADGTETEEPGEIRTQYLLQSIQVLAVGQRRTTTEDGEEGAPQTASQILMTLALEPEDAERLVFAVENGSLYFTLLPEDAEPVATPGRTLDDLFE